MIISSSCTSDPARVGRMSRETYLPAGMEGVIVCPVQADPPVLYINWTKDGNDLNLDNVRDVVKKYNVWHLFLTYSEQENCSGWSAKNCPDVLQVMS